MKTLLDTLLPRMLRGWEIGEHFLCVPHQGKSDLEASFPRKLKAWREPGVRFVIVRDNDGSDCVQLKKRYKALCKKAGRPDSLVRLVCQELESWYLGDLQAIAQAFGVHVDTAAYRKRFVDPDLFNNANEELSRLVPAYQKVGGARAISVHLEESRNRSHSLRIFLAGVRALASS